MQWLIQYQCSRSRCKTVLKFLRMHEKGVGFEFQELRIFEKIFAVPHSCSVMYVFTLVFNMNTKRQITIS